MRSVMIGLCAALLSGCGGCDDYASAYSCDFVENDARYEVWYWRDVEADDEADNSFIGYAVGTKMCLANARAFAAAIGDDFEPRAYICVLRDDGYKVEKHRHLGD